MSTLNTTSPAANAPGRRCGLPGEGANLLSRNAAFRRRLPNRRDSVVIEFDLDGTIYRAQVSQFEDGTPGELFLDGPKIGSAACIAARDAAVAASLALQHGCDAATLHHACVKLSNGLSAGPVGRSLDMMSDAP